jgi:hypothetical protein
MYRFRLNPPHKKKKSWRTRVTQFLTRDVIPLIFPVSMGRGGESNMKAWVKEFMADFTWAEWSVVTSVISACPVRNFFGSWTAA